MTTEEVLRALAPVVANLRKRTINMRPRYRWISGELDTWFADCERTLLIIEGAINALETQQRSIREMDEIIEAALDE